MPWWNNTQFSIFYFLQPSIIQSSLLSLDTKSTLQSIVDSYYNSLIALKYEPLFDLRNQIPNKFELRIKIGSITDISKLQILKAELKSYYLSNDSTISVNEAKLQINIEYLSNFDTLLAYGKPTWEYVVIFITLMLLIIAFIKIILIFAQINLFFKNIVRLIIFPIFKGFILALFICSSFLALFFLIADQSKYSAIPISYDSGDPDSKFYAGRLGLTILLVGYFLLSIGISQSFKVLTPEQTKNMIEDDLNQKNQFPNFQDSEQSPY